jgi:hypothetical protein
MRLIALLLFALALQAQTRLSVEQLRGFLKSSVELHQPDKTVANYLKKVKLTNKLTPRQFEDFIAMGAGPLTIETLRDMMIATKDMVAPAPEAAKPAAVVIPPPSPEEQQRVINEARAYAMGYSKGLPDFLCMQVTRRYIDPSGLGFFGQLDVINARLSYFDQKEDYKVMSVNGRSVDTPMQRLGGATSSGEFGSMMKELFEPDTMARFEWLRWATLRGKRTHVFQYYVAQPNSHWTINYQDRQQVTPGYRGLVYVERDTLTVTRLTLEADIPPDFPVQEAKTTLDYDMTDISGKAFKNLVKNEVEFRMYRKFGADTSITFDVPEPLPESATKETAPKPEPK